MKVASTTLLFVCGIRALCRHSGVTGASTATMDLARAHKASPVGSPRPTSLSSNTFVSQSQSHRLAPLASSNDSQCVHRTRCHEQHGMLFSASIRPCPPLSLHLRRGPVQPARRRPCRPPPPPPGASGCSYEMQGQSASVAGDRPQRDGPRGQEEAQEGRERPPRRLLPLRRGLPRPEAIGACFQVVVQRR
jgi:hypothetical protein